MIPNADRAGDFEGVQRVMAGALILVGGSVTDLAQVMEIVSGLLWQDRPRL